MTRFKLTAILLFLPATVLAQQENEQENDSAWSRAPREIPFQNDSQWEDNRWQEANVGPFVTASIETPGGPTLKGIAIRVGDRQQVAVCFDTARLRISAAWTGEFLQFGPRRFGIIERPAVAGHVFFTTPKVAGWAYENRFLPEPHEITLPDVEQGYTAPGSSVVHLPQEWAAYRGLYTSGNRVVLSYSVGSTDILESPWYVETGDASAFVRSLEIGPSSETMRLWAAGKGMQVTVIGGAAIDVETNGEGFPIVVVAPHDRLLRMKLLITKSDVGADALQDVRAVAGDVEDLSQLIDQDSGRWPDVLETEGETTESGGPYAIDTLTLPFENPYKALLFTSGHDFFSDGTAAVCMMHGDVWTVSGIDRNLKSLRWRRFATGLFQPLGLKIVDDKAYVIGRDQITRLHDRNSDGEADYYENFNNDLFVSPRNHDFVTCLDTDPDGNFYFIHGKTGVMRVLADGSAIEQVADGFRNPNGMAVGPDGTITAAPQQGTWTPESSLIVVNEGGYYGYGGPRVTDERPEGWDLPMCFIPRPMDNSGGAQVWVEGDRWGPLNGQMLHLSYGQCRMLLTLIEVVDGVFQGGTIKFPTAPADFDSGIMRGRFNPHDGQLYVSGLRGWQTRAVRDGCLQRVRYTGEPLRLPVAVKTYTNGILLTFSEPLEYDLAVNPDNFLVEQWNYKWTKEYGSPDYSVIDPQRQGRDEVPVVSATLTDDARSIFLEMPGRHPVHQLSISWLLSTTDGERFRGTYAHTINTDPRQTFPETQIVRLKRLKRITDDLEQRLRSGLAFHYQSLSNSTTDSRVMRLVAFDQPTEESPTLFLPPGPFSLNVTGTMRTPLSGFYDFKIEGTGQAELTINNETIVTLPNSATTAEAVLLHKGHNLVRIRYKSPPTGDARLRLLWKGYNFNWEPVPSDVFFHDSGSSELVAAQRRRHGRQLFANHHCARCHQADVAEAGMFELSLAPPDLSDAGHRFRADWLQKWMLNPVALRPDTRMPALLGQGKSAERDAADIAAYLLAQRDSSNAPPESSDASGNPPVDGKQLSEDLGCIVCHHFEPVDFDDEFERYSLSYADQKFQPGALVNFIQEPHKYYAASRMPDFRLSEAEARALSQFIRSKSEGKLPRRQPDGDPARGRKLFDEVGCRNCHSIGSALSAKPPHLVGKELSARSGCLSTTASANKVGVPSYRLTAAEIDDLATFVQHDLRSLQRADLVETSNRLVEELQCGNCHDRDGKRSHRMLVIAEEGSGRVPPPLPALTWAGEKLQPSWTKALLAGELDYKSRPWIKARMPAFPSYARAISQGLAAEHGIDPQLQRVHSFNKELATIGQQLTRQTALDCRQCHAIGDQQPRGDKDTQLNPGINFSFIRDRMRPESYQRFMFDPPRYDLNTKMIKLSENGLTTKIKEHFDADARRQFDAVWNYMQSLPSASAN